MTASGWIRYQFLHTSPGWLEVVEFFEMLINKLDDHQIIFLNSRISTQKIRGCAAIHALRKSAFRMWIVLHFLR